MTNIRYPSLIVTIIIVGRHAADVHGCDKHGHHHLGHHQYPHDPADNDNGIHDVGVDSIHSNTNNDTKKHGNLRRLGIFDNISELLSSNRPCKDGEPTFTVGNVTYACRSDFQLKGGVCATSEMSSEERIKANEHFLEWKSIKDKGGWLGRTSEQGAGAERRRLGGCGDCVDWSTTTITVPTYFHVIHSGETGKKYTYASNPAYIQNQVKSMNIGFRGEVNTAFTPFASRSYPRYNVKDARTNIQFCLMGTSATDNASWYADQNSVEMKTALKIGGPESLNVYVNNPGGYLGYTYYPSTNSESITDGVVLMNGSMPGGDIVGYNEGDTLTHEVGHWLDLGHTHGGGCEGPGDYMDLAPPSANYASVKSNEAAASFGCPVNSDTCLADSGKSNPIHSFMSYGDVSSHSYLCSMPNFLTLMYYCCINCPSQLRIIASINLLPARK